MPFDANIINQDVNGNIPIGLPLDPLQAGYVLLAGELAASSDPTGRLVQDLRTSTQGRLTVGQPVAMLNEAFNNTAINSAIFTAPVTTMTVTFAGGTANLNAGASAAANGVARLATYMFYPLLADMALYATWGMLWTQAPQVNCVTEAGLFQASGTAAPSDGAFFRFDATGTLKAVLSTNGSEVTSAALTIPATNSMWRFKIIIGNDRVLYYIEGACQAVIQTPTAAGLPTFQTSQPWTVRTYNGATGPTLASVIKLGYVFVGLQDSAGLGKSNAAINALMGHMASQGQTGHTVGSTALYTNNLAAGAGAAMTNTTAALGTGLGGQFSVLPTLAVGTDGILCSYLNPAATSAIPGKTLYITGIRLQGAVTTVLAGGPVLYACSLAYGHTSVSLATTETGSAKAPRRLPLGYETFAANAVVGTLGSSGGLAVQFQSPIAVNPGEYVAIAAKNLGVVTTTGVITVLVAFDGYFE